MLTQLQRLNLHGVDLRRISPLARILLTTEGTVTVLLETCMLEPIDICKLSQELRRLSRPLPRLNLPRGAETLDRRVLLVGRESRTPYIFAASHIALDRLGEKVRDALLNTEEGLGMILREHEVETTWKILGYRLKRAGTIGPLLDLGHGTMVLNRTYQILIHGLPTFLIIEHFSPQLSIPAWDWKTQGR